MSAPLPRDAAGRVLLMGLSRDALAEWLGAEIEVPASKIETTTRRIWTAIYRHGHAKIAAFPGIRGDFRQRIAAAARIDPLVLKDRRRAADGTQKFLFGTDDGAIIESVLIPGRQRLTLCISSQIGCAMRCAFCLTGTMGLRGDLNTAEIVGQVIQVRRALAADPQVPDRALSNVVFMGMGEPLHNPQAVIPATRVLIDHEGLDLSARRVTVSTSGIVPAIDRLGAESPVQLAVSLNATTDEVRDWLMPINRKYPIASLLAAIRRYPLRPRERVLVEYVLLAGINDQTDDIERLATHVRDLPVKINLIAFNPHAGSELERPSAEHVLHFRDALRARGIAAGIRETRGDETMAACGQLGRPPGSTETSVQRRRRLPLAPPV